MLRIAAEKPLSDVIDDRVCKESTTVLLLLQYDQNKTNKITRMRL